MEESGLIRTLAAYPRIEHPVHNEYESTWTSETVWAFLRR